MMASIASASRPARIVSAPPPRDRGAAAPASAHLSFFPPFSAVRVVAPDHLRRQGCLSIGMVGVDLGGAGRDAHPRLGYQSVAGALCRIHGADSVRWGSSVDAARGIRQGCPRPGTVWALIFYLAVRLLHARVPWLRDELSVSAGDIAATLAEVLTHLLALLRVFNALRVAAGKTHNCANLTVKHKVSVGLRPQTPLDGRQRSCADDRCVCSGRLGAPHRPGGF